MPANATLVLQVGGDLAEVAPADVVGYLRGAKTPTVRSIVDNLRKAKVDARVSSVLLKPTGFESPYWGKVQEIRDAVLDFKKSGKPVYAYLEYGGDREYYLATAADKVFLMPSSPLDLNGVATYELFLRGTLDKIGAYPDLHHIGDYKTASNQLHRERATRARTRRWTSRSTATSTSSSCAASPTAGRRAKPTSARLIDEGPFLPGRRAARRPGRRCGVRGSGGGEAAEAARGGGERPTGVEDRRRRLRARQHRVARPEQRARASP